MNSATKYRTDKYSYLFNTQNSVVINCFEAKAMPLSLLFSILCLYIEIGLDGRDGSDIPSSKEAS